MNLFWEPGHDFKTIKLTIFVDGEFWQGKDWHDQKSDHKTNKEFWFNKIKGNIERDKKVNYKLEQQGWRVLRFWGKDIHKNLLNCVLKVERD
ncbi:MAG: DUF559 domain-containing protein [Solitalea-like symbiont of Acarus siro]